MSYILAALLGAGLDLMLGDPHWMPHPVRWMGRLIAYLEGQLRSRLPATPKGEILGGGLLAGGMLLLFSGGSVLLLRGLDRFLPVLSFVVQVWLSYQLLAARCLFDESMAVFYSLRDGNLPQARLRLGRIVGRDTQDLDPPGITRAAVETVAENTSDGVTAPLLALLIGGVPLAMAYKAINTMDSMLGYRTHRYLYFGRIPARLDDVVNFIPARLSGLIMCLIALVLPGFSGRRAFRIFFRDRLAHKSPNSAHTEAACAGALGVQLGGDSMYFGELVHKPTIGDADRSVCPQDILRANLLMFGSEGAVYAMGLAVLLLMRH